MNLNSNKSKDSMLEKQKSKQIAYLILFLNKK